MKQKFNGKLTVKNMKTSEILKLAISLSSMLPVVACNVGGAANSTTPQTVAQVAKSVDSITSSVSNNVVIIEAPGGGIPLKASVLEHYSADQHWGGATYESESDGISEAAYLKFTAKVNRHNDGRVGKQFNELVKNKFAITRGNYSGQDDSKVRANATSSGNFYFAISLTVNGEKIETPVYLEQFNSKNNNDWALGNESAITGEIVSGDSMITLRTKNHQYCFTAKNGSTNTFGIFNGECENVLHNNIQNIHYSSDIRNLPITVKYTGDSVVPFPFGFEHASNLDISQKTDQAEPYDQINFKIADMMFHKNTIGQGFLAAVNNNFASAAHKDSHSEYISPDYIGQYSYFYFATEITIYGHKIRGPVIFDEIYTKENKKVWVVGNKYGQATTDNQALTLYTEETKDFKSEPYCISNFDAQGARFDGENDWRLSRGKCVVKE